MAVEHKRLTIPDNAYGGIFSKLTKREQEVVAEMGKGLTISETSRKLGISPSTVKTHRSEVGAKFLIDDNEYGNPELFWGPAANLAYIIDGVNHGNFKLEFNFPPSFPLSEIEFKYLDLAAHRKLKDEIANIMGVSIHTAKDHLNSLREKLDANNFYHMVARGVDLHFHDRGILVDVKKPDREHKDDPFKYLTTTQKMVFELVKEGLSNQEINERLSISYDTTKNHFRAIRRSARAAGLSEDEINQVFRPYLSESKKPQVTKRELEILQLKSEGKTHQEIGNLLGISVNTVASHLRSLRKKSPLN